MPDPSLNDPKGLENRLRDLVSRHGPFTASNFRLSDSLCTLGNGVNYDHFKLNRIKQIISDWGLLKPGVTVLDVASLESLYGIELALEGLHVSSVEGREGNIEKGKFAAFAYNLSNMKFHLDDVMNISPAAYGTFDIVLCLGILYHISKDKYLKFIDNLFACCNRLLIIDTFVSLRPDQTLRVDGAVYRGTNWREFEESAGADERKKMPHAGLHDTFSFSMTKESLIRYLESIGVTSIAEIHTPSQPHCPIDRITLACRKETPVRLKVFPEFNRQRDFNSFVDTRGIGGKNIVYWNRPKWILMARRLARKILNALSSRK